MDLEEFGFSPRCALRPAGVEDILKKLLADECAEKWDLELLYNAENDHCFWLTCRGEFRDEILQALFYLLNSMMESGMRSQVRSVPYLDNPFLLKRVDESNPESIDLSEYDRFFYPGDVMKFPHRAFWQDRDLDNPEFADIKAAQFLLPEVIAQMQAESGAYINLNKSGRIAFIGASTPEVAKEVQLRIQVLRNYFKKLILNPTDKGSYHLCYQELHGKWDIDFQRPDDVHASLVDSLVVAPDLAATLRLNTAVLTCRPNRNNWNHAYSYHEYLPKPGKELTPGDVKEALDPFRDFTFPEKSPQTNARRAQASKTPMLPSRAKITPVLKTTEVAPALPRQAGTTSIADWIDEVDERATPELQILEEPTPTHPAGGALASIISTLKVTEDGTSRQNDRPMDPPAAVNLMDAPLEIIEHPALKASSGPTRNDKPSIAASPPSEIRHSSMAQKAPPRSAHPVRTSLVRDFEQYKQNFLASAEPTLMKLIFGMRIWTGTLDLSIQFGRLFVKGLVEDFITPPNALRTPLEVPGCKPEAILADMSEIPARKIQNFQSLSYLAADANFLVNRGMWKHQTTAAFIELTVRINHPEGLFKVIIRPPNWDVKVTPLDDVQRVAFVHCPQRMWDFTIQLKGYYGGWKTPRHQRIAGALRDALRIKNQSNGSPSLEIGMDTACGFAIVDARIRLTARSWHKKLPACLWVDKMIPLKFNDRTQGNRTLWSAVPGGPTHYEARVTSIVLGEALKQHEDLELGREADWTFGELKKKGGFQSLILPALQTVDEMDSIGASNARIARR